MSEPNGFWFISEFDAEVGAGVAENKIMMISFNI